MPKFISYQKTAFLCALGASLLLAFPVTVPAQENMDPESFKAQKAEEGYILDLRQLIDESKKKIKKVDEKLKDQAKRRRNQQREAKAREYYNQAMELFEEGKLKKAQEYWEKAIKITEHPEMKDYIAENIKKQKRLESALREAEQRRLKRLEIERGYSAEEVQAAYDRAVSLFKQKNWIAAKNEFELVDEMFPDHKATRSYLMIIEQEIRKEQEKLIEKRLREEAIARRQEKEEWKKKLREEEAERQRQLREQAETLYQEAVKLRAMGRYEEAKEKFQEIEWIIPDYKSTLAYLKRIDKEIEQARDQAREAKLEERIEEREAEKRARLEEEEQWLKQREMKEEANIERLKEEADFIYDTAVSLYKKDLYGEAKDKFEEVQEMFPLYRETEQYLEKIDQILKERELARKRAEEEALEKRLREERLAREREERMRQEEMRRQAELEERKLREESEIIYNAAISLYKNEFYIQSKEKFQELQSLNPGFRSSEKYIAKIDRILADIEKSERREKKRARRQEEERQRREERKEREAAQQEREEKTSAREAAKAKRMEEIREEKLDRLAEQRREMELQEKIKMEEQKRIREFNQMVEDTYQVAVGLFRDGDYKNARERFLKVRDINTSYRSTEQYLTKIEEAMRAPEERPSRKAEKKERTERKAVHKETVSEPARLSAADLSRAEEEAVRKAEAERRKRLEEMADIKYREALEFYEEENFVEAKRKFIQVEAIYPGYKSTEDFLRRIDEDIVSQKPRRVPRDRAPETINQREAERRRSKLRLLGRGEKTKDKSAVRRKPEKRDIEKAERKTEAADQPMSRDELYRQAVKLYKNEEYAAAEEKFLKLSRISPKYKSSERYLRKIDKQRLKLRKEEQKEREERYRADLREDKKQRRKTGEYEEALPIEPEVSWHEKSIERVAKLKAEERQREEMNKERYEEFRRLLEEERRAKERALEEQRRLEEKRKKKLFAKLKEEEKQKKRAMAQQKRLEKERVREFQAEMKMREREEELRLAEEKRLEEMRQREEELRLAEEKRLEEMRQREEERQRREKERLAREEQERKEAQRRLEERLREQEEQALRRQLMREADEEERLALLQEREEQRRLEEAQQRAERKQREVTERGEVTEKDKKMAEEKAKKEALKEKLARKKRKEDDKREEQLALKQKQEEYELRQIRLKMEKKRAKEELERMRREKEIQERRQKKILRRQQKAIDKALHVSEAEQRKRWNDHVEILYREAVDLYKENAYEEAKIKFSMVEGLHYGYKSAQSYISRINRILNDERRMLEKEFKMEKIEKLKEEQAAMREQERIEQEKAEEEARRKREEQERQRMQAEKERRKKEEEERLARIEAEKEEALAKKREEEERRKKLEEEKEEARLAEERKRLEEEVRRHERIALQQAYEQQRDQIKQLKEDIDRVYRESLDLYRAGQTELSKEKFKAFQSLISNEILPEDYRREMRERIDRDRKKIEMDLAREKREQEEWMRKQREKLAREKKEFEAKRERELKEMEKKLRMEEERLTEERMELKDLKKRLETEDLRTGTLTPKSEKEEKMVLTADKLQERIRDEEKVRDRIGTGIVSEAEKTMKPESASTEPVMETIEKVDALMAEKEKRREIERLIEERQKEIEAERQRIKEEFNDSLARLYERAVALKGEGAVLESRDMLVEIRRMRPGYKDTEKLIKELENMDIPDITQAPLMKRTAPEEPDPERRKVIDEALDMFEQAHN